MTEAERSEPAPERAVAPGDISGAVEALLLMANEPMAVEVLADAVGAPSPVVEQCLSDLVDFYDRTARGFELRRVAGGWRYYTRPEHADLIGRWVVSGQSSRLSQAALETLAVIAYLQPISRSRVSAVRGVNVDGVVRTLLARDLIAEVGHDEETGAVHLGTTDYFLERLGLARLEDLPPIAPLLPDAAQLEEELSALATTLPEAAGVHDSEARAGSGDNGPTAERPAEQRDREE
ncbi:MAG TPA: SMC-Scp complex subunit ScpB [Propionibacteriaceae bacterium]|nr:SMC-Scp complex subunit ScpB [Propionibacteriaceae bacterium]